MNSVILRFRILHLLTKIYANLKRPFCLKTPIKGGFVKYETIRSLIDNLFRIIAISSKDWEDMNQNI